MEFVAFQVHKVLRAEKAVLDHKALQVYGVKLVQLALEEKLARVVLLEMLGHVEK